MSPGSDEDLLRDLESVAHACREEARLATARYEDELRQQLRALSLRALRSQPFLHVPGLSNESTAGNDRSGSSLQAGVIGTTDAPPAVPSPDEVEELAKGMTENVARGHWDEISDWARDRYRDDARAALRWLASRPSHADRLREGLRKLATKWRDDAANDIERSEGHHIACFQHARELENIMAGGGVRADTQDATIQPVGAATMRSESPSTASSLLDKARLATDATLIHDSDYIGIDTALSAERKASDAETEMWKAWAGALLKEMEEWGEPDIDDLSHRARAAGVVPCEEPK